MNLNALYHSFLGQEGTHWIMKPQQAQALYHFVKDHNIKKVLELGTGVGLSTAVIALALKEKKTAYSIDTVEQFEKCIDLAKKYIPSELQEGITFHRVDPVLWDLPELVGQSFMNFKELPEPPEGGWDVIIVDGPGPFMVDGNIVEVPNGDVLRLHMEGKINKGTLIYFDGRLTALSLLERFFGHNFWILDETKNQRANIIERKDNKVECKDARKEAYIKDGYFS